MHIKHKTGIISASLIGLMLITNSLSTSYNAAAVFTEGNTNYLDSLTGNLLADSSFELGKLDTYILSSSDAPWKKNGNLTENITSISSEAKTGTKSVALTRWGAAQNIGVRALPGSTWHFSAWVKLADTNTVSQSATITLNHHSNDPTEGGVGTYLDINNPTSKTWQKIEGSYTIPANSADIGIPGFTLNLWNGCSAVNCFNTETNQPVLFDDIEFTLVSGKAMFLTGKEQELRVGAFYSQKWYKDSSAYQARNAFIQQNPDMLPAGEESNAYNETFLQKELDTAKTAGISFFSYDWNWDTVTKTTDNTKNYALNYALAQTVSTPVYAAINWNMDENALFMNEDDINLISSTLSTDYFSNKNYVRTLDGDKRPLVFIGGYISELLTLKPEVVAKLVTKIHDQTNAYIMYVSEPSADYSDTLVTLTQQAGFDAIQYKNYLGYVSNLSGRTLTQKTYHDYSELFTQKIYTASNTMPLFPGVLAFRDERFNGSANPEVITGNNKESFLDSLHVAKSTVMSSKVFNPLIMLDGWNDLDKGSTLLPTARYGSDFLNQVKYLTDCLKAPLTESSCWLVKE